MNGKITKSDPLIKAITNDEENKLVEILEANQKVFGSTLADLKGINPSYCMNKILMEENYKPIAQPQRHIYPIMKEVVRKEVIKLLEASMI